MGALDTTRANAFLDNATGAATYSPTLPLKLRLMSANGTKSVAGTEVTGGSYAPATIAFAAAAAESAAHNADITFTSMPAGVVAGVEIWDSHATPKRVFWGPLTASRTLVAGDDLKFPTGSVVVSFNLD